MGLVGLALFSKARKAATSVEIVEKFLLFSKTGVVALTYYIDARIAAGYCAVFAGMITQMQPMRSHLRPRASLGPSKPFRTQVFSF